MAVRPLVARVEREPDHAVRVGGVPEPEHRGGHRQVLVDPEERDGVRKLVRAARRRRRDRLEAVRDPRGRVVEERPQLTVVEPRGTRRANGHQQGVRLPPVRVVRGVDDLLGRHEPVEVEEVERAPDRGVEEHARPPGEVPGHRGEVDDPRVRDDQRRRTVPVEQPGERVGDRRQAAAAVDQDRDAPLRGEREDGLEPGVVGEEPLRPRVELDPTCPQVQAARRLLDGPLLEVEAYERQQLAGRRRGVGKRPVVRRGEGGPPVGLVEAEGERAGDPVGPLDLEQLVAVADHPVDVVPEVDVGVEDRRVDRKLGARELPVPPQELVRTVDRVHGDECMEAQRSSAASTRSTKAASGTEPAQA